MITVSLMRKHGSAHMQCLERKVFLQVNRCDFRNLKCEANHILRKENVGRVPRQIQTEYGEDGPAAFML